ncbi:MAG: PDZ domain-containing protein [Bacteroidetes bacterium]|jgi:Tol biopolymer transport system component/C-terminal processing protease CtpA/Prc|nr:PDZ domain-containing protein [Bacteroidota bacterium]
MKYFLSIFAVLFSIQALFAQTDPLWLRYPSISPDGETIIFTYKGDLYRVSSDGGEARQLTFHEAHDFMPVWSQNGSSIAFASDRYGNFDIYVMDALGGPATRLTYHSNDEHPYTFSHDNSAVLFGAVRQDHAEHRQYPTSAQPELYSVPANGGRVGQVFTIPAEDVQTSSEGQYFVYHDKKGYEDKWRKHHTSSITRDLWIYNKADSSHTRLTDFEGEDRNPVFDETEESLFYLSEESGSFNVHKLSLENPDNSFQLTNFDLHPVRFLSHGNGVLAFSYDGELYTMTEDTYPQKVDITVRTQEKTNSDQFITINGGVNEMAISPNGKEIAFVARGEVFVTNVDGSLTKRITNTPEQEQFVTFSPDGKQVAYAAERDGRWSIFSTEKVRESEPFFYASTLLQERELVSGEQDNYMPQFSPDGKKLAYIFERRTLRILNLETQKNTDILTPDELFHMRDGDKYFRWSPDSNWLLVGWDKLLNNSEILLLSADGNQRLNLTKSGYYDGSPKWINDGNQMIWFSNRDGLRSYATSGRTELDVYSMFFTEEAWDKFKLSKEEFELMQEIKKANKEEQKPAEDDEGNEPDEDTVKQLEFNFDQLTERTARLTIHSSFLSDAVLSKDGEKLYYLARFEDDYNLWETNLRTKETKMAVTLNTGSGSLMWDKEMKNLYLLSRGNISKIDLEKGSSEQVTIAGEMTFDEKKERKHLLEHIYLRTKKIFYEPTFHGNDWDMLYKEYQKYLPHISNEHEFAEMISEWLGELNVSHAGGRYSTSMENGDETASLGIFMDWDFEGDGIRIDEVIEGGPLDKSDISIEPGSIITAIDGDTLTSDQDIAKFLNHKAGDFVLLEVQNPNSEESRQITVQPITLSEENNLLYERFVEINEQEVEEKSNGRLGYVHIPGMSDEPYRVVFEKMLGKYLETDGVIVDTRFNRGGDLVADLAMFFTGERFLTYATEAKVVGGEPTSRWTKPTLSLFNESMYSDGHCYASGYTDLEIGTTVGMPVPGTCSFAGWERLSNGVVWGVVPVSAKNKAGEWLENNQVEPDIRVKNQPGVISNGRDQQLERAIEELINQVSAE